MKDYQEVARLKARNRLIADEMRDLNRGTADVGLSKDDESRFDRLSDEFDRNKAKLDRLQGTVAVSRGIQAGLPDSSTYRAGTSPTAAPEYARAFEQYLRRGTNIHRDDLEILNGGYARGERRAQSVSSEIGMGRLLPVAVVSFLIGPLNRPP